MTCPRRLLAALLAAAHAAPLAAADVTYHEHVAPILKQSCLGCHAGDEPKGDLGLETLDSILAGVEAGPLVVPGKPAESRLYLLASREQKPAMPPKREDALGAESLDVLRRWIEGGAKPGTAPSGDAPYSRPLQPPAYSRPCAIPALAYSADGKRLFVAAHHEVLVHEAEPADPAAGSLVGRWLGEAERLNALVVSPGGALLAAAGGSPGRFGELQLWNIDSGTLRKHLRAGRDTLFAAAFSADGKRLALGGAERTVRVVEVETLQEAFTTDVHSDWVFALSFADGASRLISAGRDRTVKAVEAAGGEPGKFAGNLATLNEPVFALQARPGSPHVVAAGEGREPVAYDARENKEVRKYERQPGAVLAVSYSADGKLLAVGGAHGEVRVYGAEDGARKLVLRTGKEWTYAVAFRPDGERLAAAGYEGAVRIFGLKDDKEIRTFIPAPLASETKAPAAEAGGGAR